MKENEFREFMVSSQIERRGIKDSGVLAAMKAVPRHLFVPEPNRQYAYEDTPIPIGEGQTISQPYIVALMTQSAKLQPGDKVLEIGTGSGYQAAILSQIVKDVYTVERMDGLSAMAQNVCQDLGYSNIHFKIDDGSLGWEEFEPYDAILVTAGSPQLPKPLVKQLAIGGRLIIPVGDESNQNLMRITKLSETETQTETLEFVRFVPLIGESGWHLASDT